MDCRRAATRLLRRTSVRVAALSIVRVWWRRGVCRPSGMPVREGPHRRRDGVAWLALYQADPVSVWIADIGVPRHSRGVMRRRDLGGSGGESALVHGIQVVYQQAEVRRPRQVEPFGVIHEPDQEEAVLAVFAGSQRAVVQFAGAPGHLVDQPERLLVDLGRGDSITNRGRKSVDVPGRQVQGSIRVQHPRQPAALEPDQPPLPRGTRSADRRSAETVGNVRHRRLPPQRLECEGVAARVRQVDDSLQLVAGDQPDIERGVIALQVMALLGVLAPLIREGLALGYKGASLAVRCRAMAGLSGSYPGHGGCAAAPQAKRSLRRQLVSNYR